MEIMENRENTIVWMDSHCHVEDLQLKGKAALETARTGFTHDGITHRVGGFVNVGINEARSGASAEIASRNADVWATAGQHPHTADGGTDWIEAAFRASVKMVGIGECGLDFNRDRQPRQMQRDVFAAQIRLAHRLDTTLVIHTRDAWEETFSILDREGWPTRTVLHCFTGGVDEVTECLAHDAWISASGIVTYGPGLIREAFQIVPQHKLLVETDAPYLTPEPLRSAKVRVNTPVNVGHVGAFLAALRNEELAALAQATVANTRAAFGLDG